ncbi:trehalose-phosphatase [Roseococcus sp. YIM B11640]|uniref:trehalose-phosphatase n=1 Tax=Roseococcus sp. YIM B11640 TaxID=3133973 RepID=UPI003C7DF557
MPPKIPRAVPSRGDVLSRAALLLDIDGTLLEIAPRPDEVVVPPGLRETLAHLHHVLDGAVALVTGRTLSDAERLFAPLKLPTAAEHAGLLRLKPDVEPLRLAVPEAPGAWRDAALAFAKEHPGVVFENKLAGFVLHYRLAPEQQQPALLLLRALLEGREDFEILPAQMAWEIRPLGVNKGMGVREIMNLSPFRGRWPIFIGDDVTDEDGIVAAESLGGLGFRVPTDFATPADVRAWLASLTGGADAATA